MVEDEPGDLADAALPHLQGPFPASMVRRVTRQCLVSYQPDKPPQQRGMSQKAILLMSNACGLFLRALSPLIVRNTEGSVVKRRTIIQTILQDRKYYFAVTRMRPDEIFRWFVEANELSRRIAIRNIERPLRFPIEFISPNPCGQAHTVNDTEAQLRETENVDAALRAIVIAHHSYRQTIPDCFKLPSRKD